MSDLPVTPAMAFESTQSGDAARQKMAVDNLQKRLHGEKEYKVKLREACEGFESIFIQKMWEQMRKNVSKEGYLHSKEEESYQAMFDVEFSKSEALTLFRY